MDVKRWDYVLFGVMGGGGGGGWFVVGGCVGCGVGGGGNGGGGCGVCWWVGCGMGGVVLGVSSVWGWVVRVLGGGRDWWVGSWRECLIYLFFGFLF